MFYFLISITTLIVIAISIIISRLTFGSSKYLFSPTVIALIYYIVRVYPGTVDSAIYYNIPEALIAVLCGCIGGLFATATIMVLPKKKIEKYFLYDFPNKKIIYFFIFLGIFSVVFTFIMLGRVPLFYMFGGDSNLTMHEARRMNTLEHRDGNTIYFGQGYFRMLYLTIAPLFIAILYTLYRIQKRKLTIPIILMVIFCIFGALNGQIWPTVNLILMFCIIVFAFEYIFLDKHIKSKDLLSTLGKGLALLFFVFIFIFSYRYAQSLSGREFENFFIDTFKRIYADDTITLYRIFPEEQNFRIGSTWLNDLLGFLPGSSQNFSYEVHYLVHGGGWGYTLTPGLFASGYVNFGYFGSFIIIYLAILVYGVVYKYLINMRSIECRVFGLFLSLSLAMAISADVASLIYNLLVICIVISILFFLSILLNFKRFKIEK